MSRYYIDIDDAIEIVTKKQGMWATTLHALCDAPKIDIVKCKECKYWRNTDAEKIPTASIACGNMHADDFCSYGEREGE